MSGSKTIQFPPQAGAYKIVIHEGGGWRQYDIARLQVSVGKPNHEGDKFWSTCEWAAARFKVVHVEVSDTNQRYNLMAEGMAPEEARAISLKAGEEWLERNAEALDLLPNKVIHRWDRWLTDPRFPQAHAQILALYASHEGFKYDIDRTAASFLERQKHLSAEDLNRHLAHSIAFLLEEAAVFAIQQQTTNAVDVYPGTFMKIFDRFKHEAIPGAPAGLDQRLFTRIDFLRNKKSATNAEHRLAG